MRFNHVANRLRSECFEAVVALFEEKLGFAPLRRTERAIWMRQKGTNVDLQFSRIVSGPSPPAAADPDKKRSQISFLSEEPEADLKELVVWLSARGIAAMVGSYSEKEFYLDAPAAFVDFVIEAMTPDLADYGIDV